MLMAFKKYEKSVNKSFELLHSICLWYLNEGFFILGFLHCPQYEIWCDAIRLRRCQAHVQWAYKWK